MTSTPPVAASSATESSRGLIGTTIQPITSSASLATDIRLDAPESFYWVRLQLPAEIGSPVLYLRSRHRAQIEEQLTAEVLPPIDDLAWVAVASGSTHVLVCLQDRGTVVAMQRTGALHYGPEAIPPDYASDADPLSLNFLTGPFTPRRIARTRWSTSLLCATIVLLIGLLLAWGLERRARAAAQRTAIAVERTASLLRAERQPSLSALIAQRDRLAVTRQRLQDRAPPDAARALVSLLHAWPVGDAAPILLTDSVSITSELILVQCSAQTREDATLLTERLASFTGSLDPTAEKTSDQRWVLAQPQITASGGASTTYPYKLSLRLSREPKATSGTSRGGAHE